MAYTVGEVEVDVLPNAQEFNARLAEQINPGVARAGRQAGDQIADDIADGVRRGLERARAEMAGLGGGHATINVDADTAMASAKIEALRAETDSVNNDIKARTAANAQGLSPLIAAGIAGGLALGAPAMIAGAGLLFGGIAAAGASSSAALKATFTDTLNVIEATFTNAAQVTVPFFQTSLARLGNAVQSLGPQFGTAFAALRGPLDSLTTGVVNLLQNAMPGLVSAVQSAGPVFQGLSSLLSSIGTGLGQFFSIIADHSSAAGAAFSSLGSIVGSLLPILGQLVSAGAELAANVLPPVAAALSAVASALNFISPVLPGVLAAFLGFKAISLLSGPLDLLSAKLQTVAADAEGFASKLSGRAASAVSGLASALPAVGLAVGALGAALQMESQQIDTWGRALLNGGQAAASATAQMKQQADAVAKLNDGYKVQGVSLGSAVGGLLGYGGVLSLASNQQKAAAESAKTQYAAMSPLEQATQDVTARTNDLQLVLKKHTAASSEAKSAAGALADAQGRLEGAQRQVTLAMEAGKPSIHDVALGLQGIADAASQAKSDTNLFKTALDQLTGKTVDLASVQASFYAAVDASNGALKGLNGTVLDGAGNLNVQSEAGRKAQGVLFGVRDAASQYIGTLVQQGATADEANAKDAELRGGFVQTARQMGISAGDAENLANQIYGIPEQRKTEITAETAAATQAVSELAARIAAIQSKTITVGVNYHVAGLNGGPGGTQLANAQGNIVHAYADGGFEPMQGGIAQIVPPQTMRIIGDRVTDDEAYIPINNSMRSLQILAQTASRMNFALTPAGGGAGGSSGGPRAITVSLNGPATIALLEGKAVTVVADALEGRTARAAYSR